jgi:hypothetical protein
MNGFDGGNPYIKLQMRVENTFKKQLNRREADESCGDRR